MSDAVNIFASDEARRSDGTGGFRTTAEMLRLINQPGYISLAMGGQRLRGLYQRFSAGFTANMLKQFALYCFIGQVEQIKRTIDSGQAPDLTGTETPYKFGYCTFVVAGAQRGAAVCPGSDPAAALQLLLSSGAPADSEDIVGYTALHHATQNAAGGALALARILLEAGASPNHQSRYGEVPILGAFQTGDVDAVELLMEFGADMDIADADDVTPRGMFPRAGPRVAAAVTKWLRKRAGEAAPMDEKACAQCGTAASSLKFCGRCHAARYCSPTCQRAHWPTHKRTCQPFDITTAVTVRPRYRAAGRILSTADTTRELLGIRSGARPARGRGAHAGQAPSLQPGESKRIIIKVQVPMALDADGPGAAAPSGDMLVYTKRRDFVCQISKADNADAYARISRAVREKGVGGLKAYFPAELNGEDELVVKIGEVLAEQPF
ncbi:ankyrin [Wolfiporia cocos MD-104 SS10]|uniref:Ankyrin n=1 Tax=Wolfiporia cocos (strain MD-104) TaxID=742152 RepID=A0A2H3JMV5_WOLCO|nr:ankyrin [Wolfiporia cocos MD-104 SS10]